MSDYPARLVRIEREPDCDFLAFRIVDASTEERVNTGLWADYSKALRFCRSRRWEVLTEPTEEAEPA